VRIFQSFGKAVTAYVLVLLQISGANADQEASLDLEQLCAQSRTEAVNRISAADRNDDGVLSAEEHATWREGSFMIIDENGDGRISAEEHSLTWIGPDPICGASDKERKRAEEHVQSQKALRYRVMDGDANDAVSVMEFMRMGELIFSEADANNDGAVTLIEFQDRVRGM